MNTSITEKQLTDIKKSLENSLVLVSRGLRHFSSVSKHTDFTPAVSESLSNPDSVYFKYPEFLVHFQLMDVVIELHRHSGFYCCYVSNWIPKSEDIPFTDVLHYTLNSDITYSVSWLKEARLAPHSFYEFIKKSCFYGKCETFEDGLKLFSELLYQFLNVEELPF